jgi:HPt (histidine-containing phosphotransfer) domain-containing protein
MLRDFSERHQPDVEAMTSLLGERRFDDARQIAHRLKGAAGTLGLARLRMVAAALETVLRKGQTEAAAFAPLLAELKQETGILADSVAGMRDEEPVAEAPAEIDPASVHAQLSQLEALLAADDTAANDLMAFARALLEQAFGVAAVSLAKQIDNFDYPAALDTVRGMLADSSQADTTH